MKITPAQDYADWKNGNTSEYAGLWVKPKLDFGSPELNTAYVQEGCPEAHGRVVVEKGCNVLPGATWAKSREEALTLIDVFLAADRNGQKFWHLLRAIQRMTGKI